MEKEILDSVKNENLENLEDLFKILSEKVYNHRREHNSIVPFNIFPSCLAIGGISSVVEVLIECYDSGKFKGYLLKKREKNESEWQGLYQIPGTIIRLDDSPEKIFERLDKEIWKKQSLVRPIYFGTEIHNELIRKVIRTSMLYILKISIEEIDNLLGEWKLFKGVEPEIVSHHREVIYWKENKTTQFVALPESDVKLSNFKDKTILITGGLGFIGSNLAIKLSSFNPKKIIIVDSLVEGLGGDLQNIKEIIYKSNIEVYQGKEGDIKNITQMKSLIKESDFIFNLAGSSKHTPFGEKDMSLDIESNFLSQIFFLEACRQVMNENPTKKLVILFAGTRDQYGKVSEENLPVKEDYLPEQLTDYQSINKNAIESYHLTIYHNLKEQGRNIKITSLRLTNTYGPGQNSKVGAVVPIFVEKAIKDETIELWGGGEILRDLNYIDDVIEAFLLLACSEKTGGEIYNLGCCIGKEDIFRRGVGGNLISILELSKKIVNIASKGRIKVIPYPSERKIIEPGNFAADISKIYALGWKPKTSLEDGLKKVIDWHKEKTRADT